MHARKKAQEDRRSREIPSPATPTGVTSPAPASPGTSALMALQRSAGNAAVAQMLGNRALPVQRMDDDRHVLSGHGRFGDNQLLPANPENPRSRKKKPTFTMPDGVELVIYAPPGAWLENEVAKLIESGTDVTPDDLEMVGLNNKRKPMPDGYPKTFRAGEEVINYKLMPLEAKNLAPGATSVDRGTLQEKVHEYARVWQEQPEGAGPLTVHYACCGVGNSSNPEFEKLFEHRNWTVELRTTDKSRTPTPEPVEEPKRKKAKG